MTKVRAWARRIGRESLRVWEATSPKLALGTRRLGKFGYYYGYVPAVRLTNRGRQVIGRTAKHIHHHVARRPHSYLLKRLRWYDRWHHYRHHVRIHAVFVAVYSVAAVALVFNIYHSALASDLTDTWDFASTAPFTLDSGIETNGASARLKAQNYTSDANTKALYHLDETSGTSVSDSSSNGNTGTVGGTASWITGNLNNALSLSSALTNVSAPDSASLSLSQANTLEAWTKFSSNFGAGSHDHAQGIIDKGAYKLYYDNETGKVTYELANSAATTWTQRAGNDVNGSWDLNGKLAVMSQTTIGNDVYVGLGNGVGDAEVWKWDGTWTKLGGDGINSSWADQTFESVLSLTADGNTLYAGLGTGAGDGEVWSCNTASNCATWTKIGGDGINSSWAINTFEEIDSLTVLGGNLYAGLGTSANNAEVWRWNGSAWTKVGGDSLNSGWTTNYEQVASLTQDGTNVYAGLGNSAGDAEVWSCANCGTSPTWTKIGGDSANSSWDSTYEIVLALRDFGGNLYAGLGNSAGDAEVWSWNGSSWTKIGGDTTNSSWDSSSYEAVYALADDGTNLYAGLGNDAGDNEVWKWNGSSWTKIGGDGVNSGFSNTHTIVQSLAYTNNKLYAGLTATADNGELWSFSSGSWTVVGGGYVNKSWGFFNLDSVETMTVSGSYLYAGTGKATAGDALLFRFDGSTWQIVGGQGIDGSWPANTYESVTSLVSYGGDLYVGLGTSANNAEVWRYSGGSWTKIGGDSVNSGWTTNYEEVSSLAAYGGNLYAGLGNSANDAEVWKWNGSSWSQIGGDSLYSGWTTNYERVSSLAVFGGDLYAGLGNNTTDAEVWRWSGSSWTKIGGDGVNSSWNTNYEQVESLIALNGKLYAGLGDSTADAEVWEFDGSSWTKIGGDGLNSSWTDGQYEQAKSLAVYNGKLYAGLGNSAGDGEVWEYSGGGWSKVGGSGVNSSWAAGNVETVRALNVYQGRLYAGLGDSPNADAAIWSYGDNGFLQAVSGGQNTSWHHIAATYDGSTMRIYIDGTLNAIAVVSLSMPDNAQALMLGSTYGSSQPGLAQGYFDGSLDEVRISNIARGSFTTKPYATTPQTIILNDAVRTSGVWHWDTFSSDETANGGTVTYRLSDDDGSTWKYWNGSAWVLSSSTSQANDASTINAHVATFTVGYQGFSWQAILTSNGDQQVTLNSLTLQSTSDTNSPSTAGMTISALKAAGGAALNTNDWTNGGSPYFSWNAGSDADSGVRGYCAYLGTDNSADPVTTKGLLGTSPAQTGGFCQFVVTSTDLDLASSGVLGTALSSSNSPYYLTLKAIDLAGNVSTDSTQFYFRFDNTLPGNPGYISAPSGFSSTKAVDLTWATTGGSAATDANSGIAGLQYRIGSGGTWYGDSHSGSGDINDLLTNDGLYTTQDPPDFDDLIEGINTVYFRTWDQAGNVTTTYVTAAIKINTTGAPSEPQNVTASPTSNTSNDFAFSWDPPTTFVGDVNNLTYCYTVNATPTSSNCTFTAPGVTNLGSGPYATQPGDNTFYVVARDESNNINYANYGSALFTANTSAPGVPLNLDVVDVSIRATSSWRLALTWSEPTDVGIGVASYRIFRSLNNDFSFSQVGSSTSTAFVDSGLDQQHYFYKIQACDSTNNCGAFSSIVDATPTGQFTTPANLVSDPVVSNINTRQATISWSTDRTSDSRIAIGTSSGQYSPSEVTDPTQVTAHQITLTNLSAGTTYYFVAKWTDLDGNIGTSQEFSFTTTPPPTLKEIHVTDLSLSSAVIQFTSRQAYKVNLFYGKDEGFGGVKTLNTSPTESTYSIDLSGLSDDTKYFYKLVAYDAEGGAYDGSVFSFITPARPHITNLRFQPLAGEPTSTQVVSWLTNVPATSSVTYGKLGSDGVEVSNAKLVTEHEIIIRDLEDDSEYFLVAQSRDAAGNLATSDRQIFHTALDTRPPKISEINIESSIRGTGAEARGQIVVSWQTDEPATSQVAFGEGSGIIKFNNRTAEDQGLGTEHIMIISDLPTSKVYSVQPISKDKVDNTGLGDVQSAIIGRASDSILTIILEALKKVFGF